MWTALMFICFFLMNNAGCIPANPDITGIGVRTAMYAQNILSIFSAAITIFDKKVTPIELEAVETQSTTILITAFAILVSAIVQALRHELTTYHAIVVLNLSWINNTNTFIYLMLHFYQKLVSQDDDRKFENKNNGRTIRINVRKDFLNPVSIIGSVHLSLMAAVGIWLWSNPSRFDSPKACSMSASIAVLGHGIPFVSKALQVLSIMIYALLLFPILNLYTPVGFFGGVFWLYWQIISLAPNSRLRHIGKGITPVVIGFIMLLLLNLIFLIDTEVTMRNNDSLLESGDAVWTFGQTLALLLLLVPIRDLGMTGLEIRQKKLGKELLEAAGQGHEDVVKSYLRQGANIEVRDKLGRTALIYAAENNHMDVVKVLISRGRADVKMTDTRGWSALHFVARKGGIDVVELLLQKGADLSLRGPNGQTVLSEAANGHNLDVVQFLVEYGVNIRTKESGGWVTLLHAAQLGRLDVVQFLIKHGVPVNAEDSNGRTALFFAASEHGHLDIVHFLIDHKANVNAINSYGWTALGRAAWWGHLEIAQFLIKHEADVHVKDSDGWTALNHAALKGHLEIVKLLVQHKADVNAKGFDGQTALLHAEAGGHSEIVELLIEHGATSSVDE